MFSKNQIKLITSLQQKKFRQKNGLFVAEGAKVIQEFLDANFELYHLYETTSIFNKINGDKKSSILESDLKKISFLTTANNCLALFKIPQTSSLANSDLIVVLDSIRDPGNLGTIIRLCDWFGVQSIVCSEETADCYNPKVVQATMGSLARVTVNYCDLPKYLSNAELTIYGTFMDGKSVYETKLPEKGILVLGNEGVGISDSVEKLVNHKISIPRFGLTQKTESLNVATATAIFLSEFKRNVFSER
ncbi:MAG: TrmH family RNA methyltransferase [Flavobacterium sp.]|jgi:TrmH family RNA methyltransferase